jgi:hypothetical protein
VAPWPAPPHFFRQDRLIVLYFATKADRASHMDRQAIATLQAILGRQFASAP